MPTTASSKAFGKSYPPDPLEIQMFHIHICWVKLFILRFFLLIILTKMLDLLSQQHRIKPFVSSFIQHKKSRIV